MKLPVLLTILLVTMAPATLCRTSAQEIPAPRTETRPILSDSPHTGTGGGERFDQNGNSSEDLGKGQSPVFPDHEIPTTPANLREHLLSRVEACRSMPGNAAPQNSDGRLEVIDDVANGYVQVSAEWPPCGCNCKVTAAAFKSSDGSYTIMHVDEWGCSWTRRVSAHPPLHVIFPEDLTIAAFIPSLGGDAGGGAVAGTKAGGSKAADGRAGGATSGGGTTDDGSPCSTVSYEDGVAWFCLDAELPRIGTDVKLTIRTIPFGMRIESKGLLAYGYAEADGASNCTMLFRIRDIAEHLDDAGLGAVVGGRLETLTLESRDVIQSAIGDDASRFRSIAELTGHLERLRRIYDMYCRVEHEWVVLAWEREKATFYIRDRGPAVTQVSFREFLLREKYWSPGC